MGYRITEQIGKGGQGTVFLAKHTRTGAKVVAKKVHTFSLYGRKPLEVYILQDILPPHRSVLKLIDYDYSAGGRRCDESLMTYTEFCSGGTIDDLLPRKKNEFVDEGFIWHVLEQMAEALALLHHGYRHHALNPYIPPPGWMRIIHRDIKPDNLFLRKPITRGAPYPDIVLGDFGFATTKPFSESIAVAEFAPPEMPYCSHKGDVWSLGTVIYELATGTLPTRSCPFGVRKGDWFQRRESKKVGNLPMKYSPELDRTVKACLNMDRIRRIDSIDLFQRARRRGRP